MQGGEHAILHLHYAPPPQQTAYIHTYIHYSHTYTTHIHTYIHYTHTYTTHIHTEPQYLAAGRASAKQRQGQAAVYVGHRDCGKDVQRCIGESSGSRRDHWRVGLWSLFACSVVCVCIKTEWAATPIRYHVTRGMCNIRRILHGVCMCGAACVTRLIPPGGPAGVVAEDRSVRLCPPTCSRDVDLSTDNVLHTVHPAISYPRTTCPPAISHGAWIHARGPMIKRNKTTSTHMIQSSVAARSLGPRGGVGHTGGIAPPSHLLSRLCEKPFLFFPRHSGSSAVLQSWPLRHALPKHHESGGGFSSQAPACVGGVM